MNMSRQLALVCLILVAESNLPNLFPEVNNAVAATLYRAVQLAEHRIQRRIIRDCRCVPCVLPTTKPI